MSVQEDTDSFLKNTYKRIKLYPNLSYATSKYSEYSPNDERLLTPCVSFNTVPSTLGNGSLDDPSVDFPGVQIPPEFSLDDLCNNEGIARSVASIHSDYYSPRGSAAQKKRFTRKSLADSFKRSENGKIVRVDYPSEPAIFNEAFILTKSRPQWHQQWSAKKESVESKLDEKHKWFRYPIILFPSAGPRSTIMSNDGITPMTKEQRRKEKIINSKLGHPPIPRTILCHISGRRHTWVSLDWTLRRLAQNTDHIVVVANLPKFSSRFTGMNDRGFSPRSRSRGRGEGSHYRSLSVGFDNGDNEAMHQGFIEWGSGYNRKDVERKIMDIFRYIRVILPCTLAVKITVEIVIGKTKKVMLDAMNCYTPDFCIESTLKWERTDNLVVWKSKTVKDVLCTKFPIPVFVVPARRMYDFESEMQREFLPKTTDIGATPTEEIKMPPITMETLSKTKTAPVSASSNLDSRSSLVLNHSSIDDIEDDDGDYCNNDKLTIKEKLKLAKQRHRKNMMQEVQSVNSNRELDCKQRKLGVLDGILRETLEFSEELQTISKGDFQGDDGEDISELTKVFTGSTHVLPNSKRSMLDVFDSPKSDNRRHHRRSPASHQKPRSGQIKFASNVHAKDGNKALGNSRGKSHLDPVRPSLGQYSYSQNLVDGVRNPNSGTELRRVSSGDGNTAPLRKVMSANNVSRVKSNDSSSLSPIRSSESGSGLGFRTPSASARRHYHSKKASGGSSSGTSNLTNTIWGGVSEGAGGLLSLLMPNSSRSHSHSRRSSSGSDSEHSSVKSSHEGKKKKSFFGW